MFRMVLLAVLVVFSSTSCVRAPVKIAPSSGYEVDLTPEHDGEHWR